MDIHSKIRKIKKNRFEQQLKILEQKVDLVYELGKIQLISIDWLKKNILNIQ